MRLAFLFLILTGVLPLFAQAPDYGDAIREEAQALEDKVIEWRRHIHANPELSNRETETAAYVAKRLESLGLEVRTGIAHTGLIGILRGGKKGPTVALRADMDALPVTERTELPFASKVQTNYLGSESGVSHACGHDTHVAMLLGAAELLSKRKADIPGTIVFLFQPAEEGPPPGEEGGAKLMIEEGVLNDPKVDAIFGIHINSQTPVGTVRYREGGIMAASDRFTIKVNGKQTHGSSPWAGVDPIAVSAQIVQGLQQIVSRQIDITDEPAVISVGKIEAGVRYNIIPESAEMVGTIRTFDTEMQKDIHRRIRLIAENIAEANGATVDVDIQVGAPVTYNHPKLTQSMVPTLKDVAKNLVIAKPITGAEDFAYYAQKIPALFVFVGGMDPAMKPREAPSHHTPDFYIDERGLVYGVELYSRMALDYLHF